VHASFQWAKQVTVDDHEQPGGLALNSLHRPTQLTDPAEVTGDEYEFRQHGKTYTGSFYGDTVGMVLVAASEATTAAFRTSLISGTDLRGTEVWVRAAEVYDSAVGIPPDAAGFKIALADASGTVAWLDSDDVGGVPRPYDRSAFDPGLDYTKTMLTTLRFPARCFGSAGSRLDLRNVDAILLRPWPSIVQSRSTFFRSCRGRRCRKPRDGTRRLANEPVHAVRPGQAGSEAKVLAELRSRKLHACEQRGDSTNSPRITIMYSR
jgi:hypothetical protein